MYFIPYLIVGDDVVFLLRRGLKNMNHELRIMSYGVCVDTQ